MAWTRYSLPVFTDDDSWIRVSNTELFCTAMFTGADIVEHGCQQGAWTRVLGTHPCSRHVDTARKHRRDVTLDTREHGLSQHGPSRRAIVDSDVIVIGLKSLYCIYFWASWRGFTVIISPNPKLSGWNLEYKWWATVHTYTTKMGELASGVLPKSAKTCFVFFSVTIQCSLSAIYTALI